MPGAKFQPFSHDAPGRRTNGPPGRKRLPRPGGSVTPDTLAHNIFSREVLKAYLSAAHIARNRVNGKYENEEVGSWFPQDITELEGFEDIGKSRFFSSEKIGRPAAAWELIKNELIRMEADKELPIIMHGWRSKVSQQLANWYSDILKVWG